MQPVSETSRFPRVVKVHHYMISKLRGGCLDIKVPDFTVTTLKRYSLCKKKHSSLTQQQPHLSYKEVNDQSSVPEGNRFNLPLIADGAFVVSNL